jgi:hypothetical protein
MSELTMVKKNIFSGFIVLSLLLSTQSVQANYLLDVLTSSLTLPFTLCLGFFGFVAYVPGKLLPTIGQNRYEMQNFIKREQKSSEDAINNMMQILAVQHQETKKR